MRKILIVFALLITLTSCFKNTIDVSKVNKIDTSNANSKGVYVVKNKLGIKVTDLYLYEEGNGKGKNLVKKRGLRNDDSITLTYDGTESTVLVLEYIDENGGNGKFSTLIIEEATMSIISEDVRTGPTIVSFD